MTGKAQAAGGISLRRRRIAALQRKAAMTGPDNAIATRAAVNASIKALLPCFAA